MSIGFTYAMSISAVRKAVWEKIIEWYNDYIYVQYIEPDNADIEVPSTIIENKDPTIPSGYEKIEILSLPHLYCAEYKSSDNIITFLQHILKNYSMLITI